MEPVNIILIIVLVLILVVIFIILQQARKFNPKNIVKNELEQLEAAATPLLKKSVHFANEHMHVESSVLANKLKKLKHDVGQLVMKSVTEDRGKILQIYHNVMGKYDEKKIAHFIDNLPQELKKDVALDGATIKEPMLKMYGKNFTLFDSLYKEGLIPLLGNIVGMSYWSQNAQRKTLSDFAHFVKCLSNINWASKDVWSSVDSSTGYVAKCMN